MNELTKPVMDGISGTFFWGGYRITTNISCALCEPCKYDENFEGKVQKHDGTVEDACKHNFPNVIGILSGVNKTKEMFQKSDMTVDDLLKILDYENDDFSHYYFRIDGYWGLNLTVVRPYIEKLRDVAPFDVAVYFRNVKYTTVLILDMDGESTMVFAPCDLRSLYDVTEATIIDL